MCDQERTRKNRENKDEQHNQADITSRLRSQEVANSIDEFISFFQMRTMTAFRETDPFDLAWDLAEEGLHGDVLSFIVIAVN